MKDGWLKEGRKKLEVAGARLGMRVIGALPRRVILALARGAGTASYLFSGKLRRIGMANLDLVFGESKTPAEKRTILRRSFQCFALMVLDLFWFSRDAAKRIERYASFEPEGERYFTKEAQVCMTAHLGNWEFMARAVSHRGFPLWSVATPLKNPAVDALLVQARESTGQVNIPRKGALKALIKALKDGQKVGMLLDQNTALAEGGQFIDFFGVPATISPAAAALSLQTGTEIAFGFCIPQPDGSYRTRFPAFFNPGSCSRETKEATLAEINRRIADVYEQEIRLHPECWLWSYKRWKYIRPGDDPKRYPFYARPSVDPKKVQAE